MSIVSMLVLAMASAASPTSQSEFRLACPGIGTATRSSSATGYAYGNNGESAFITSTSDDTFAFEGVMQIELSGKEGAIRIPAAMLPTIRGGKNGVIRLKGVKVSENEITARVDYNFINKPRIVIDRLTGMVSMDDRMTGAQFSGRCEAFDPSKFRRAF